MWYVYVLRCGDGTLYTGTTDDVARRLAAHRAGKGAKYTRGRGRWSCSIPSSVPTARRRSAGSTRSSSFPERKNCT